MRRSTRVYLWWLGLTTVERWTYRAGALVIGICTLDLACRIGGIP